jgi:hypothetical protein
VVHSIKHGLKSAVISAFFIAITLLLAGCGSVEWPHVYGPDEVPQSVRNEPRPVPPAPPVPPDATYPLLGNVPTHPKDFTPPATINQTKQQMEDDKAEAQVFREQANNPSIAPPPVVAP